MNTRTFALAVFPAAVLAGSLISSTGGTLPGSSGIASDSARQAPSCTSCHSGQIGALGVATRLSLSQLALAPGESVTVQLQVTGGPSGSRGGFAAENSGGTFVAGTNTRINTSGRAGAFATHSGSNGRTWSFRYTAPSTPGLQRVYAVAMSADGSGRTGDVIAFHGTDPTASVSTPIYVGVHAAGNQRLGQGCVGSFGNWPVLYATETPSVGNANYALQLAGAAPNANALFLLGLPRAAPMDLTVIGAAGCGLWVDVLGSLSTTTTNGNAQRGEGTATGALPIPNDPALRGALLASQVAIVDPMSGRTLPITLTNGLTLRIQ
jgi:hypothetical protein